MNLFNELCALQNNLLFVYQGSKHIFPQVAKVLACPDLFSQYNIDMIKGWVHGLSTVKSLQDATLCKLDIPAFIPKSLNEYLNKNMFTLHNYASNVEKNEQKENT